MARSSSFSRSSFRSGGAAWTWDDVLLRVTDVALAGVIFVAPLFMGGRHPVGKLVYVLFACAAALTYTFRQYLRGEGFWRRSGAEWLIVAVALLLLLQMAPLPPSMLERASPGAIGLLPLWQFSADTPVHFGPWNTISLIPRETQGGLVIFLAHSLMFLTLIQRLSSRQDIERLLGGLALACVGMAVLGLLQYFFGNGKFLWVYLHPSRETSVAVKGAFSNQNHLAQFLALGVGALLWVMWRRFDGQSSRKPQRHPHLQDRWQVGASVLLMAALAMVAFAGLLTYSRGGVIALFVATAVCVGTYAWKKLLGPKSIAGLAVVGVAASIAVLSYGYEPLMQRLGTFRESKSLEELSSERMLLWTAMLQSVPHHLAFGSGVGSHIEVYPIYLAEDTSNRFTHGENGYLQVLLETGVAGAALLLAGIVTGFSWCMRALRNGDRRVVACVAPVMGGLAASVVQSCGDFVWYIPACMSLAVVLLACACRLWQITREELRGSAVAPLVPLSRAGWGAIATAVVLLSVAMVNDRLPPAYAAPFVDQHRALSLRAQGKSVWSSSAEMMSADSPGLNARLIEFLEEALKRDPYNAEANMSLAQLYLKAFEIRQQNSANAIGLVQIRDAALASNFPSREAQDQWLDAAVGENRRFLDQAARLVHRSLALCPLQGEGYVALADIAFLDGLGKEATHAYIEQAKRVRPYHGGILMAAGQEAALEGNAELAMTYWKRAFHVEPDVQGQVVTMLAGRLAGEQFCEFFEPDAPALRLLHQHYRMLNRSEDAAFVAARLAPALAREAQEHIDGPLAAQRWSEAADLYKSINRTRDALACISAAVEAAPGNTAIRRGLGFHLLEAQHFEDAIKQFQWVLRHDPDDESARAGLARAMSGPPTAPLPRSARTPVAPY